MSRSLGHRFFYGNVTSRVGVWEQKLSFETKRWSAYIPGRPSPEAKPGEALRLGVLKGEGCGPEVVDAALQVLSALTEVTDIRCDVRFGGPIGRAAVSRYGTPLCDEVVGFCEETFAANGAILAGAGDDRFVYDLRERFDLYCKICPVNVGSTPLATGVIKADLIRDLDCLLIRENSSGVYNGEWSEERLPSGQRRAEHRFGYTEEVVTRILEAAAGIAGARRGKLMVVQKESGIPTISRLWTDCAATVAAKTGVDHTMANIDYAAYYLVQHPQELDVVVSPNLFGDILADISAVLLGSRALSISASFSNNGAAVYQTNHGAARDLAGCDRANPLGQILSLAMLLRESYGLFEGAQLIEQAVCKSLHDGWRTADLAEDGCRSIGTIEMGNRIAETLIEISREGSEHEASAAAR